MFKKIISLFLITALISALLISCGTGEDKITQDGTPSTVPEQTTTVPPTPTSTTDSPTTHQTTTDLPGTTITTVGITEVVERPMEKNVTVYVGETSVTPTLILSHSLEYNNGTTAVGDGLLIFGYPRYHTERFAEDRASFPVLSCKSIDEVKITVNGAVLENPDITLYDEVGNEVTFSVSGRYYACVKVKFTGDVITQNGSTLFEEYSYYGAFFTLDVE